MNNKAEQTHAQAVIILVEEDAAIKNGRLLPGSGLGETKYVLSIGVLGVLLEIQAYS